jgi:hypothetical protein
MREIVGAWLGMFISLAFVFDVVLIDHSTIAQ